MRIALWPDWVEGQSHCTIGAVGTDKYSNNVAITAGHCWGDDTIIDGVNYDGKDLPDALAYGTKIYDADDMDWDPTRPGPDPIAYLRFYKGNDGNALGHPGRDYAVLELAEGTVPSSQGPHIKMTGIHELPDGTIDSPYVVNRTALPEEKVLGTGIFSNHQLIASGKSGVFYGRITNNSATGTVGVYQAGAQHVPSDSGGPAVIKDASVDFPSSANNFQTQGKWVGITKAIAVGWPPYQYTSSANIVADLRTRDIASGSDGTVFGAGFQVTTNP